MQVWAVGASESGRAYSSLAFRDVVVYKEARQISSNVSWCLSRFLSKLISLVFRSDEANSFGQGARTIDFPSDHCIVAKLRGVPSPSDGGSSVVFRRCGPLGVLASSLGERLQALDCTTKGKSWYLMFLAVAGA